MAYSSSSSSTTGSLQNSQSKNQSKKNDVFISFRGEETRKNIRASICRALSEKRIEFFDDEGFERGEKIEPAILNAIKDSRVSIVIFSKSYPKSTWCLDELVQIFDCMSRKEQKVLPVFHNTDPSDVQENKGNYDLKLISKDRPLRKVMKWRKALTDISTLSGIVWSKFRSDVEFVEEIVKQVEMILWVLIPSDSPSDKGLVGIHKRVREVESLLRNDKPLQKVGIWGIEGIGKTTTAEQLWDKIGSKFDHHHKINVAGGLAKYPDTKYVEEEIHSRILGKESTDKLTPWDKDKLKATKVLILLDDVENPVQLGQLIQGSELYHADSKIIIISRHKQVLRNVCEARDIYKVKKLAHDEALRLFSLHAFKKELPKDDYKELSLRALEYADGHPLALKIIGCDLYGRHREAWEGALEELKKNPNEKIKSIFRRSYDGLTDNEKKMFLDIACLFSFDLELETKFSDSNVDYAVELLENSGLNAIIGLLNLLDTCLITLDHHENLSMPGLMIDFGKAIVREENNTPGRRSRLWHHEDISQVLETDMEGENIEGILLNPFNGRLIKMNPRAFIWMRNLRFLKITVWHVKFLETKYHTVELKTEKYESTVELPEGLEFLPESLKYLHWEAYPSRALPLNFTGKNLTVFHMLDSDLEQLWSEDKVLENLKSIDVSYSANLMRIPDLSRSTMLTRLNLNGCNKIRTLPEIPLSIKKLDLNGTKIERLPSKICKCRNLIRLSIKDCKDLKRLPEKLGNLTSLEVLQAQRSGIERLPDSINKLKKLRELNCSKCENLILPPVLSNLTSLKSVFLSECCFSEFPEAVCSVRSLEELDLSGNVFESIPHSIQELPSLQKLNIKGCSTLERVRVLPNTASALKLEAAGCKLLKLKAHVIGKSRFHHLDLGDCTAIDEKECSKILESTLEEHIKVNDHHGATTIRIPGSEVPKAMKCPNRSSGEAPYSLILDLDRHDLLVAVSFCGVVKPLPRSEDFFWIGCKAIFEDELGYRPIHSLYYRRFQGNAEFSPIVSLWRESVSLQSTYPLRKVTFQFFYEYDGQVHQEMIIKCGVYLIYKDDPKSKYDGDESDGADDNNNETDEYSKTYTTVNKCSSFNNETYTTDDQTDYYTYETYTTYHINYSPCYNTNNEAANYNTLLGNCNGADDYKTYTTCYNNSADDYETYTTCYNNYDETCTNYNILGNYDGSNDYGANTICYNNNDEPDNYTSYSTLGKYGGFSNVVDNYETYTTCHNNGEADEYEKTYTNYNTMDNSCSSFYNEAENYETYATSYNNAYYSNNSDEDKTYTLDNCISFNSKVDEYETYTTCYNNEVSDSDETFTNYNTLGNNEADDCEAYNNNDEPSTSNNTLVNCSSFNGQHLKAGKKKKLKMVIENFLVGWAGNKNYKVKSIE